VLIEFTVYSVPVAQPAVTPPLILKDKTGNVLRYKDSGRPVITKPTVPKKHPVHQYRHDVGEAARLAMLDLGPQTAPLILEARFYLPRPRWCDATIGRGKKKRLRYGTGPIRCDKKPDLTNLLKSTEDAMSKIVWRDDALVVGYGPGMGKWFHGVGEYPRVEIKVWDCDLYAGPYEYDTKAADGDVSDHDQDRR